MSTQIITEYQKTRNPFIEKIAQYSALNQKFEIEINLLYHCCNEFLFRAVLVIYAINFYGTALLCAVKMYTEGTAISSVTVP